MVIFKIALNVKNVQGRWSVKYVRKIKITFMFQNMAANPDLRSGFETDLNPDLTKNLDPD